MDFFVVYFPNEVQNRLGHKKSETTMNIYAHALPSKRVKSAHLLPYAGNDMRILAISCGF